MIDELDTTVARCAWRVMVTAMLLGSCQVAHPAPPQTKVPEGSPVHDPITGRWWTGISPGPMDWEAARTHCEQVPPAGQWRLPHRGEVEGLFEGDTLRAPFLPAPDGVLFTGEVVPGRTSDHVWVANPHNGHMFNGQGRLGYARCVRNFEPAAERQLTVEVERQWFAGAEVVDPSRMPTGEAYVLGPAEAPVTLWYFFDYTCPFCKRAHHTLTQLVEQDPRVRVVYQAAPILPHHPHAEKAHAAAYAAGLQGRYWEMSERLFTEISRFQRDPAGVATELADELGLDRSRFEADYHSPEVADRVQRELAQARALEVAALPTIFVEGTRIMGARPLEDFKAAVDAVKR